MLVHQVHTKSWVVRYAQTFLATTVANAHALTAGMQGVSHRKFVEALIRDQVRRMGRKEAPQGRTLSRDGEPPAKRRPEFKHYLMPSCDPRVPRGVNGSVRQRDCIICKTRVTSYCACDTLPVCTTGVCFPTHEFQAKQAEQ